MSDRGNLTVWITKCSYEPSKVIKDSRIFSTGIFAAPRVTLYTKQMSRITIKRTRPTQGDTLGIFQVLGEAVLAFVILLCLLEKYVRFWDLVVVPLKFAISPS